MPKTLKRHFWGIALVFLAACGPVQPISPVPVNTLTITPTPNNTIPPSPQPTFTLISPTSTLTTEVIHATTTPSPLQEYPTVAISTQEQEAIKSVIQAYFDARYLTFNKLQLDGFGDLVSDRPDAKVFLKNEMGKLALEIKYARWNHSRYADYKYYLDFNVAAVDNLAKTITVLVEESNEVIYEISAQNGPQSPLVAHMSGLEHTIVMRQEQGLWKIVSDNYNDFLWRTMRQQGKSVDDSFRAIQATPAPSTNVIALEPVQVKKWKEYQTALAKKLLPDSSSEKVMCEWEILGQAEQKVFLWAICMETTPVTEISRFFFRAANLPVVVYLATDSVIQSVEIPKYGKGYLSDIFRLFPLDVQKKVVDVHKLEAHLERRRNNPKEPPLIVRSATPTP